MKEPFTPERKGEVIFYLSSKICRLLVSLFPPSVKFSMLNGSRGWLNVNETVRVNSYVKNTIEFILILYRYLRREKKEDYFSTGVFIAQGQFL